MNEYQIKLYHDLIHNVTTNEAFFVADHYHDSTHYKIFNYRLASYTNFLMPSALECRGIMFEMDSHGQPVRLSALPMHKFFNLHENPMTMDLDISTVDRIMVKSDGSLISTYMHGNEMRLKSKGSLASDQAVDAMEWLNQYDHVEFKGKLLYHTLNGHTVNLEWVGPDNRIVLGYDEPSLIVLNVRDMDSGKYLLESTKYFDEYALPELDIDDPVAFVESVPNMVEKIEGFVCIMTDGTWFKLKTNKYLSLHRTKDSINCPRLLFNACVEEAVDDMRSMFYDDPQAISKIDEMEAFVDKHYNHMVNNIECFCATHEQDERKDFAVAAQRELTKQEFGLAMNWFMKRPIDYKASMKKNWKRYGVINEATTNET